MRDGEEPLERLGLGDHSSQIGGAARRAERFFPTGDLSVLLEGIPNQVQLTVGIECPICGCEGGLFVPYGDRIACVDCVEKENGEDGDGGA